MFMQDNSHLRKRIQVFARQFKFIQEYSCLYKKIQVPARNQSSVKSFQSDRFCKIMEAFARILFLFTT